MEKQSLLTSLPKSGLALPFLVMTILAMIMLPLPPILLDLLFTFNIALSLVVLLTGIYTKRPLDFAIFPSVLLIATLLRLALNIASTRAVLLNGHTGTDAAGKVIQSFGEVVIGGNYTVGLVVFAILVIINFVVVTKGAGRISEVTARFTLDAMPGKQMAIDADLNAGLITQEEAKVRRAEISQEADFYGAMDGASKFVRGDAIAGLLVLFINVIGGLIIGMIQHDMDFVNAAQNYILLTIGDGLVAQIPSLLLSTAAAMIVTRISAEHDMGGEVITQLFRDPRILIVTGAVFIAMGIIPGMPHFAFLGFAMIIFAVVYLRKRDDEQKQEIDDSDDLPVVDARTEPEEEKELSWEDVPALDTLGLEIGYRLIPLVDNDQGGQLMERIKGVRRKLSAELGFLMPPIHIRDNLDLAPNCYRVTLFGVNVAEAEIYIDRHLAINPGQVYGEVAGLPGKDPAFGLDAIWIEPSAREHAGSLGYTVVDPSTVIATHVSQLLRENAASLLGHEEVQKLLDRIAESAPKLVENLVPNTVSLNVLVKVLQKLLAEQIPVTDMRSILECIAEHGAKSQDPYVLYSQVRVALSRLIVQNIHGGEQEMPVITLQPELEQILLQSSQVSGENGASLEPTLLDRLQVSLKEAGERQELVGQPAILLVAGVIRGILAGFVKRAAPFMHVLAYEEVPDNRHIKVVSTIGQ